jgi:hypothetical protein
MTVNVMAVPVRNRSPPSISAWPLPSEEDVGGCESTRTAGTQVFHLPYSDTLRMESKTRDAGAWMVVAKERVKIADCRGTIFVVRPEDGGQGVGSDIFCGIGVLMRVKIEGCCGDVGPQAVVVGVIAA